MAKFANDVEQTGAFPTLAPEHGSQLGLTKREYFAAKAMQGMLAGNHGLSGVGLKAFALRDLPMDAVKLADQVILELEK